MQGHQILLPGAYAELVWGGADFEKNGGGVTPSKTRHFSPICKRHYGNFDNFLDFVNFFLLFSRFFFSFWLFVGRGRGGAPPAYAPVLNHMHIECKPIWGGIEETCLHCWLQGCKDQMYETSNLQEQFAWKISPISYKVSIKFHLTYDSTISVLNWFLPIWFNLKIYLKRVSYIQATWLHSQHCTKTKTQ